MLRAEAASHRPRRERPPVWRTALVIVVCLGLVLLAMTLTRILNAPPR